MLRMYGQYCRIAVIAEEAGIECNIAVKFDQRRLQTVMTLFCSAE
jgi:hypothetical protein